MSAAPGVVHAQDASIAGLDELRARAAARGWGRSELASPGGPVEAWCASPPCSDSVDRYELSVVDGVLVMVRVILADAGDGFSLDGAWQSSGSFGFRFARGADAIDLTWQLTYEPPGLTVGFSAGRTDDVVSLDPDDGAHAFALWIARELSRRLVSATSLRDSELAARASLRANVARGIASAGTIREGTLADCWEERSTPQGTGIFDTCTMRMATPEEQRSVLATLDASLARQRALLRRHYRAFHRVLVETLATRPAPEP